MLPRQATLLVTAALMGAASASAADDEPEPIHLEYSAPSDCPDGASFEGRVRALTSRARFDVARPGERRFDVHIEAGTPVRGALVVARGDSVEGRRVVEADRCSDVDDALALMVALAIDPQASLLPADAGSAAPPESTPLPAEPASARPAVQPTPLPPAPPLAHESATAARGESRPGPVHARGSVDAAGGAASFTWTVGRLDGCGLAWPPPGASAHLLACARLEAGALDAVGSGIVGARDSTRTWLAMGPLLRVEWAILGPLYVDADVAPMFRVTADRFYFAPDNTINEVPYVGLDASVGVGVHFL